jgi:hypothetical protein
MGQPERAVAAPDVKQAAAALALPPAETYVSAGISASQKSAGCTQAALVLGLCTSNEKGKAN